MRRPFRLVDVFASEPFAGNPLAVVHDGRALSDEAMQRFARWTNLSETVFLLPPEDPAADYRVRIFTLTRELPFAGHPTVGSCHAWLAAGGQPRREGQVVQECGAGLVPLRREGGRISFAAPPLLRSGPAEEAVRERIVRALRIDPDDLVDAAWADNGPGWVVALLPSAEAVLALAPDPTAFGDLHLGVVGPHPAGAECAWELRAFFPDDTGALREDPVTGSLNASTAQWLLASGRGEAPYVASQGTCLGRRGRVTVEQDGDGAVWVGGPAVTYVEGEVEI